ncbi:hypothetical protein Deba_2128 [Desulfarculus baarsii DSM 2075]|uniref:Double Cache domain-containing protein n=1 Tax=Desulfarculus baarsii (strain ATCC 33931 / DSM 2075 / LMG 7858 / VKM B-1802 / 2st14) TaxID=644282 RepID=E1QIH6_DESB2|nr:cache domain-containing protein [Desulfarculus baarsii]ADK85493.1 hypothetical protein Deba_2128 [Desulfarculus baarsii DSM 2075]
MLKKMLMLGSLAMLTVFVCLGAAQAADEKEAKAQAIAEKAAALIEAKGMAAIDELRKSDVGDNLFVCEESGQELVNTASPDLQGKNISDRKMPSGASVVSEQLALVKAKGAGWIDAPWAVSNDATPRQTRSYVKGVTLDGKTLLVGSWFYLD